MFEALVRFGEEVRQVEGELRRGKVEGIQKKKPRFHLVEDTLRRGKEVHQGEESFAEVKEALIRRHPRVRQGEEAFAEANDDNLDQKNPTFEPIFQML